MSAVFLTATVTRSLSGDFGSPTSDSSLHNNPSLTVTVLVYDYADVPRHILTAAEDEARQVYREIGIELAWRYVYPIAARKRHTLPVTQATPKALHDRDDHRVKRHAGAPR